MKHKRTTRVFWLGGAYHIFGGALAVKLGRLDSAPKHGTHPWLWILLLGLVLGNVSCSTFGSESMLRLYLQTHQAQLAAPVSADATPVRFTVAPGTPARVIGQQLKAAGLITDDRLFEAYIRVNGLAEQLEAGLFILTPAMRLTEIAEILQHAEAASVTVTIPEGWRLEQVADYVAAAKLLGDDPAELAAYRNQSESGELTELDAARYPFLQQRPADRSLEGYLFPDTYEIPAEGATAVAILQRQLDTFAAKVLPLYQTAIDQNATTLSLYEVLTLASIVEREAVVPEERPTIAGVYLNRLAQPMKLEADPTVQYAMGYQADTGQWWKTPVTLAEYSAVDSPYNTYLYAGLPPGPIASPGLSSIRAVLYPEQHHYLYFVALPDQSGRHVFAETFVEHSANVQRYWQGQ
ncbi:MAG: endolytic transglycosylase MltG [Caldilineaceae bacterium]